MPYRPTGYEPLDTLKPLAEGVWLIDGPPNGQTRIPFPTRATVLRLGNGDLWVHSPTRLTDGLRAEMESLGPVRHLVAPNHDHVSHLEDWAAAFPGARAWAAPGVALDATELRGDGPEPDWDGQIDQRVVRAGPKLREAVFYHRASRSLILTDLIEALETRHLAPWHRPLVWLSGTDDSMGHMRPTYRWSLKSADKRALADDVEVLIGWGPRRVIIAHGKIFEADGRSALEYAFRKVLRTRRWEKAYEDYEAARKGD